MIFKADQRLLTQQKSIHRRGGAQTFHIKLLVRLEYRAHVKNSKLGNFFCLA